MFNSLISIIVPVYKVERYLPRCIESILRQTYTNFELILVDDGTPDRSGIICDIYAEKDSRIRVIHKENGGVSSARNVGIDTAHGEWLTFVDSDDWVSDDYLEVLTEPLNEEKYDLTVGRLEWRYLTIGKRELPKLEIDARKISDDGILNIVDSMEFHGPCYKLFSRKIIVCNSIYFPLGIAVAEDTIFVNKYLKKCEKICMTGKTIYCYNRLNELSVNASPRYFSERAIWDEEYINSYIEWIDAYGATEELRNKVISKKSILRFSVNARSVIGAFDENEAKAKILDLLPQYDQWIEAASFKNELVENELHLKVAECVLVKDVDTIYDLLKSRKQNKIAVKTKQTVKKLICKFLEKYRDGLVKFKF